VPDGVHLSRLSDFLGITKPCGPGLNLLKSDARSGNSLDTDLPLPLIHVAVNDGRLTFTTYGSLLSRVITLTTVRRSINTHTSHIERTEEWGWGVPHLTSSGEAISGTWMRHGHRRRGGEGIPRPWHAPFPSILFFLVSKTRVAPAYNSRLILVESEDAWGIYADGM
jgi:hypothetical protein